MSGQESLDDAARKARKGKKIRGHFADGKFLTATWDDYDEWTDDRFGQVFDLSEDVIGGTREDVLAETRGSFWNAVERVEWVGGAP